MTQDQVHPIPLETLQTAVLPLFAIAKDARWHTLGTAFVVAVPEPKKAILLTAAHNIKPILTIDCQYDRHHATTPSIFRPRPTKSINLRRANIHALLVQNGTYIIIDMIKAWVQLSADVAAIAVAIRDDINAEFQSKITIDTRPINIGTPVMAVGYPVLEADFSEPPDYDAEKFIVGVGLRIEYRPGKVTKICSEGIDIHHWPGFLVDFPFDSGMSGGPVIDLSGKVPTVRGIIGGDLSEAPQQEMRGSGVQAFASMIWLAMVIKTTDLVVYKDGLQLCNDAQLLDLARHGIIDDLGRAQDHIRFEGHSKGIKYWWDPEPCP